MTVFYRCAINLVQQQSRQSEILLLLLVSDYWYCNIKTPLCIL